MMVLSGKTVYAYIVIFLKYIKLDLKIFVAVKNDKDNPTNHHYEGN
jgi:hypothetical protein